MLESVSSDFSILKNSNVRYRLRNHLPFYLHTERISVCLRDSYFYTFDLYVVVLWTGEDALANKKQDIYIFIQKNCILKTENYHENFCELQTLYL